jgi:hypothetical protein
VKEGGFTYVEVKGKAGEDPSTYSFTADNGDTEVKVTKVVNNPQFPNKIMVKIEGVKHVDAGTKVYAWKGLPPQSGQQNPPKSVATITVNVYKEILFAPKYFRVFKSTDPMPRPSSPPSSDIVNAANGFLKYLVVRLTALTDPIDIDPVGYDKNVNGRLDFYENDTANEELDEIYAVARSNGANANDIVWLPVPIFRNWRLESPVGAGSNYVAINKNWRNRYLPSMIKRYWIGGNTSQDFEPIYILFCDRDNWAYDLLLVSRDDGAPPNGLNAVPLNYAHPITHTIISEETYGGLSPNRSTIDPRPMLVSGTTAQSIGVIIAHELGHGEGLAHVNEKGNIMLRSEKPNPTTLPFRFKPLDVVLPVNQVVN